MRLDGKVALVTGGGTGIGAATAGLFRREGAHVIVMGRRPEPLASMAKETGALAVPGDAGSAGDVAAAVSVARDRDGGLDVVVANAGSPPFSASKPTTRVGRRRYTPTLQLRSLRVASRFPRCSSGTGRQ